MKRDDAFFGHVGHALRGELATMLAGVHYLLRYEPGLGESARSMLERVRGAGQRLERLLEELGQAGWIDAPEGARLLLARYGGAALVEEAIERFRQTSPYREGPVTVDVSADVGELDGDRELLSVAFAAVLDFAAARSKGQGVSVTARRDGANVVVKVADRGDPVPTDCLARLFEPFGEKEALPKPVPGGHRREHLGLGLAIARGILAAHGGGLSAAPSEGGSGLTLTCSFASVASAAA